MNLGQKFLNKIDWTYHTYMSRRVMDMPKVSVMDFEDSIDELVKKQSSLARYGDGELSLMLNGMFLRKRNISLRFQREDGRLKDRLKYIMNDPDIEMYNLRLGLASPIVHCDTEIYTDEAQHFWQNYLIENRYNIYRLVRKNYSFVDTFISRFYIDYHDKAEAIMQKKVSKLKTLWDNEDLLIIEGSGSRMGLMNNLFANVKSITRILCPDTNAFDRYETILSSAKKFASNKLIIIALGPTATVLAYDLAKLGFRALDLGHIDIEYEWFLRKATKKVKIDGKIMTEVESDIMTSTQLITDSVYESQIVDRIQ